MRITQLTLVLSALALAGGASAAGEDGNSAVGSVATAQVGPAAASPPVGVSAGGASVAADAPTSVAGTGGNAATGSAGTAQVGGGNSSTGSAATAQASSVASNPATSASAPAATVTASASLPASVGGGADSSARTSVVTVQVGGGSTASNSLGAVQVRPVDASPGASVSVGGHPIHMSGSLTLLGTPNLSVGSTGSGLAALTGTALSAFSVFVEQRAGVPSQVVIRVLESVVDLGIGQAATVFLADGLNLRVEQLAVSPTHSVEAWPLGSIAVAGRAAIGSLEGGSSDRSLGSVQTGAIEAAPSAAATTAAGTARIDGTSRVGRPGGSRSAGSIGVVQIGGGNHADGSAGAVQSGPVTVEPSVTIGGMPAGGAPRAEASAGIGGDGANTADGSAGTVQVGGGNGSRSAVGTSQFGPAWVQPSGPPVGEPVDSVPTGIAIGSGGANTAVESVGTTQIGGGNRSSSSAGTSQVGSVEASFVTILGGHNLAQGSVGTVQVGGGASAGDSDTTVAEIDTRETLSFGRVEGASPASQGPAASEGEEQAVPPGVLPRPEAAAGPAQAPAARTGGVGYEQLRLTVQTGRLPFTGLSLVGVLLLAVGLTAAGLSVRASARSS